MSTHTKSKTLFEESLNALRDKYIIDTELKILDPLLELRHANTEKTLNLLDYESQILQKVDKRFLDLKERDQQLDELKLELEGLLGKVERMEAIIDELDRFSKTTSD